MTTSLIIVSLSVFSTLFVLYAVDSLVTQVRNRRNDTNTTLPIDQAHPNLDMELGHR
ncbi:MULTISPECIES: hypothetical protein [Allobacillus]|uniref:Uncharacterized protein n=1 Tax=Allobacillus halotolerans TaxID=570278 RepID=A0ABS6GL96_9BACI|nr:MULTISPECIES: hypothetical protein [Allobacillus]MBU6079851.1 hypothetical protein [Allobacillus halotolerans]